VTTACVTLDPIWEEKYSRGHAQRYPWDAVVSFVYRHAPRNRPRADIRILEVGFGTASNLWFAAREGFSVAGVEGSASAVELARKRFGDEGLDGANLLVGDFTAPLPFEDDAFDLVIDRGALTCCGMSAARRAIADIARVMRLGGHFFFNPYSRAHTSARSGRPGADGVVLDIAHGSLVGAGQICFYDETEVRQTLGSGWTIVRLDHLVISDQAKQPPDIHAEWRAIVQLNAQ
jgi:SAM-dependent methyltransferase